jgi:copper chaperone CopZ
MKKHYKIEVDCANCALKMEEAAKKVEGITNATISFMTQKMKVEFAQEADIPSVMTKVSKACRKIEPDCRIYYENV